MHHLQIVSHASRLREPPGPSPGGEIGFPVLVARMLSGYCAVVGAGLFYVQLLFPRQVEGADEQGWATVALAEDKAAAFRRAATVYGGFEHPAAGRATGVRVVDEQTIRRVAGELGITQAGRSLLMVAEAFAGTPPPQVSGRGT